MRVDWQGVFPAATTQFQSDQSLDLRVTLKHVDAMIAAGIQFNTSVIRIINKE